MPDLPEPVRSLGRRGFLAGAVAVGAGAALAACTSNTPPPAAAPAPAGGDTAAAARRAGPARSRSASPRPPPTTAGSPPSRRTPRPQAGKYPDVTFAPVNPTNDITQQIAAIDTLINQKVDALVILPNDGSQLTSQGTKAMQAGIPVVNLDRIFDSPLAYRTWIGGDNYGMGVERRQLHRHPAQAAQRREPDHRRRSPASTACR